ncbi:MAG: hypothetical protein RLY86_2665 [Pseudomonadota bacterium]|jgi:predicted Fe-S protein YdhL (DUF1289 family)
MRDPAASDPEDYVKSPCIRVCRIEPDSQLCEGCLRSLDEIARWGSMPAEEKRAVLSALPARHLPRRRFAWPGSGTGRG